MMRADYLNVRTAAVFGAMIAGIALSAQSIPKTMLRLPDTGQTESFSATDGEDADYLCHPPYFRDNGDGTVTDTITGLMWQQVDGGEMTYESAITYADMLSLGNYTDWRLPTAQEAFSILDHHLTNPAINSAIFPDSEAEYWWTSEQQIGNTSKIWVTNAGGGIGNHPKTETISAGGDKRFHVRAVRDVSTPELLSSRFFQEDSTATDQITGLEWQRFPYADSINWEDALEYAEQLVVDGKNDWRLPNIKELESINEESISQPSVNPATFQGIGIKKYWSSTSLPNQPARAWYMDTRFGVVTYSLKTAKNNLLCVRDCGGDVATNTIEYQQEKPIFFPNPFRSQISIKQADPGSQVQLLDLNGRIYYSGSHIEQQDFSLLAPGVYFIKITSSQTYVVSVVKI